MWCVRNTTILLSSSWNRVNRWYIVVQEHFLFFFLVHLHATCFYNLAWYLCPPPSRPIRSFNSAMASSSRGRLSPWTLILSKLLLETPGPPRVTLWIKPPDSRGDCLALGKNPNIWKTWGILYHRRVEGEPLRKHWLVIENWLCIYDKHCGCRRRTYRRSDKEISLTLKVAAKGKGGKMGELRERKSIGMGFSEPVLFWSNIGLLGCVHFAFWNFTLPSWALPNKL